MSRWLGRGVASTLTAVLLLTQSPGVATADHGGRPIGSLLACDRPVSPPRCTSVGNDRWHFVYLDPVVPEGLVSSVRRAMAAVYDPTYLVMVEQSSISAVTDVIVHAADYGENGAAGWVYCPPDAPQGINARGDRWCRQQELFFNLNPRYAAYFADEASRDYIACHELGHSLGLLHWGNPPRSAAPTAATCMTADTPDGATGLHDIDRQHISAYYADRSSVSRPARRPNLPVGTDEAATGWHVRSGHLPRAS